jgi:hypothetical protein
MTSIVDYGTLATAAQSFMLDRSDVQTPMPDLVMAGEHMIYHGMDDMTPLRCRLMETISSPLVTTAGVATLPSDYLQWIGVTELSSPRRELDAISFAASNQQYASRTSGNSNAFSIVGSSLYTFPLTSNSVELVYYAEPTALVSGTPTSSNAILLKYPLLYLRAVQAAGCEWLKDWDEMKVQLQLLRSIIRSLNMEVTIDRLAKTGLQFRKQVR